MNKAEFIKALDIELARFDASEKKEILAYYNELIDEKIERGYSEAQAVASIGKIKDVSAGIKADLVNIRLTKRSSLSKISNSFWMLILVLFASPILLPVGIAFLAIFFSVSVTLLSLVLGFGLGAVVTAVAAIPIVIKAYANLGIGGAILVSGVILVVIAAFALLALVIFRVTIDLLKAIVTGLVKIIKKKSK